MNKIYFLLYPQKKTFKFFFLYLFLFNEENFNKQMNKY